ncbi:MAG: hypothetical protein AAF449_18935, partial [Myxococcota bacterium]
LQFRLHADRAALLLCGNFAAAVEAILKTSRTGMTRLEAVQKDGLARLLESKDVGLAPDEVIRLSALLSWSASLTGANGVDPDGIGV